MSRKYTGGKNDLGEQLLAAAKDKLFDQVKALVQQGAPANYHKYEEGTWGASLDDCPLSWAVKAEDLDMTTFLLEHGADPNDQTGSTDWRGCGGLTSVFKSACRKDSRFLEVFLKHGADPNVKDTSSTHSMRTDGSSTSYLLLDMLSPEGLDKARILIDYGADVNSISKSVYHNERGYNSLTALSALYRAVSLAERKDIDRGQLYEIIDLLLEKKADPNFLCTGTHHEPNPEHKEDAQDDPRSMGYISPVVCVQWTATALHQSCILEEVEIVKKLIAHGADRDIPRVVGEVKTNTPDLTTNPDVISLVRPVQCKSAAKVAK